MCHIPDSQPIILRAGEVREIKASSPGFFDGESFSRTERDNWCHPTAECAVTHSEAAPTSPSSGSTNVNEGMGRDPSICCGRGTSKTKGCNARLENRAKIVVRFGSG